MKMRNVLSILALVIILSGCVSAVPAGSEDVAVQSSAQVTVENSVMDKGGNFFLLRSMLCRQAFSTAMTNLVAQTGRREDSLRGATICGLNEGCADGVYTLQIDVGWSNDRELATDRVLSATNVASVTGYVPSVDESQSMVNWIGPKQVRDPDGTIHFLGISAMAIGRNAVRSQQNVRRAELDAQSMAVLAFMGKDRKLTDVKAVFRPVFRQKYHHPLCPGRDIFVCGYEVVSLEFPAK